jgi:hypothetical protein
MLKKYQCLNYRFLKSRGHRLKAQQNFILILILYSPATGVGTSIASVVLQRT